MNLKKAIILSFLIAAQIAVVVPVHAESAPAEQTKIEQTQNEQLQNQQTQSEQTPSEQPQNEQTQSEQTQSKQLQNDQTQNIQPINEETEKSGNNSDDLILYFDSNKMEQNGVTYTATHALTAKKGVSYVPLRSIAERLGYQVSYDDKTKETILTGKDTEVRFKADSNILTVNGVSQTMGGASYMDKGVFLVPLRSMSAAFNIACVLDGNRVILQMPKPVEEPEPEPILPPVAYFTTDKEKYRMGELIKLEDQSTDPKDSIVDRKWENNKLAFFQPGFVQIRLTVTNKFGLTSVYTKQVEITSETLYNEEDFNRLYTPVGSNFEIDGSSVLSFDPLPYKYTTEPYKLFRASGPETVNSEGILYQDTIAGPTRFMVHHLNNLTEKAKFYVIANNINSTPANIDIESLGVAGPSSHPEVAGRQATARYFESSLTGSERKHISLAPGEKKIIFDGLSALTAGPGGVVTLNADLVSDASIQYTIVMVKAGNDPISLLPILPNLNPKESIVRGTFPDSTRVFDYYALVGEKNQRLPLTDNTTDTFQVGVDGINYSTAINSGNYGVVYKIVLHRVAPNTLITFNPRGGLYSGAARVNKEVVHIKHIGFTQNTTSVLYRTKDKEETVEIWITPAAGSNLPFSFLFMPLPKTKN